MLKSDVKSDVTSKSSPENAYFGVVSGKRIFPGDFDESLHEISEFAGDRDDLRSNKHSILQNVSQKSLR